MLHARAVSQTVNVRSTPGGARIGELTRGQQVMMDPRSAARRWVEIDYAGGRGFVARRLLAQSPDRPIQVLPPAAERRVSQALWDASERYDGITYRLGCKARLQGGGLVFSGSDVAGRACSGTTVDCSGWVSGLLQLVAAAVNGSGGAVFDSRDVGLLSTHSDGQIANVGGVTRQIYSGTDIDGLDLRSGLLFGLNAGDYDWEGEGRAFDIDHIVVGVAGPDGYYISQSSSSGGGVNRVRWSAWRSSFASLFGSFRVHCVDLMATGAWSGVRSSTAQPGTEADPLAAAPG